MNLAYVNVDLSGSMDAANGPPVRDRQIEVHGKRAVDTALCSASID